MATRERMTVATSPKGTNGGVDSSAPVAGSPSPTGANHPCLCSPTTHQGSFRCRYHRSSGPSASTAWFSRSKSMPSSDASKHNTDVPNSISPEESVESSS